VRRRAAADWGEEEGRRRGVGLAVCPSGNWGPDGRRTVREGRVYLSLIFWAANSHVCWAAG
jgi:hypothetical protein